MIGCVLAEATVRRKQPRASKAWDLERKSDHGLAVVVEVIRIALAVAVDVGARGVGGVGPEVVGLIGETKEVMVVGAIAR
jgi:hypothetical protein